jgi:hypothetical protein
MHSYAKFVIHVEQARIHVWNVNVESKGSLMTGTVRATCMIGEFLTCFTSIGVFRRVFDKY